MSDDDRWAISDFEKRENEPEHSVKEKAELSIQVGDSLSGRSLRKVRALTPEPIEEKDTRVSPLDNEAIQKSMKTVLTRSPSISDCGSEKLNTLQRMLQN